MINGPTEEDYKEPSRLRRWLYLLAWGVVAFVLGGPAGAAFFALVLISCKLQGIKLG